MTTTVPGISARHCKISNDCRELHGDDGAFDEAIRRLRKTYDECLPGWKGREVSFHVVLTVERKDKR